MSLKINEVNFNKDGSSVPRVCLQLSGRLDSNTAPEFEKKVDAVLATKPSTVVCDLLELEYVSSAGVRCFARIEKMMKQSNGEALLVNVKPPIQKVFDMIKAVPGKNFFASNKELDQYLDYKIKHLK